MNTSIGVASLIGFKGFEYKYQVSGQLVRIRTTAGTGAGAGTGTGTTAGTGTGIGPGTMVLLLFLMLLLLFLVLFLLLDGRWWNRQTRRQMFCTSVPPSSN